LLDASWQDCCACSELFYSGTGKSFLGNNLAWLECSGAALLPSEAIDRSKDRPLHKEKRRRKAALTFVQEEIPTNREEMLERIRGDREAFNFIVIGGGATGVGVAVDAASRGYKTLLLEQSDFGKGTSSRSTKLVHGGVRYLEQGNISLVMEALKERWILRQNAPHLVSELAFVVPSYSWWEIPFYGIGLKMYQWLAGKYGFGASQFLSKREAVDRLPNIDEDGLRGGVLYYDGQFDDTRLLLNLVATAVEQGATLLNYVQVTALTKNASGIVDGVTARDVESGEEFTFKAKVVINATGPFTDSVRQLDDPRAESMIAPSQGAHIVLDHSFLPGTCAIIVPRTSDGRVMFAIPWHGHTLVGTTDIPVEHASLEPVPMEQEIDFMLSTASQYLAKKPTKSDILSTFAGIRPLVGSPHNKKTSSYSRDHTIHVDPSGLLSITGGKWTTYRNMAEGCVDKAAEQAGLGKKPCVTKELKIHGYEQHAEKWNTLAFYGADAFHIKEIIRLDVSLEKPLHAALPYCAAEIIWVTRAEMARTVEDVLARRTRALFLNAKAAMEIAPRVAQLMAGELGHDGEWQASQVRKFLELGQRYSVKG
jgi:glycerol-3-phosphate dehydrogenase